MSSTLQKIQDSKLYKIEELGKTKVNILEERRLLKESMLNTKVIKELNEYVFGTGENPFSDIQELFEKKWSDTEKRIDKILDF